MGLVYSTEGGRVRRCRRCGEAEHAGPCGRSSPGGKGQGDPRDGVLRVRRETGGRGGKTVTTVTGVAGGDAALRELTRELKRLCGSGGAVKDGVIELQGDHRDRVVERLQALGHSVKVAGG